MASVANFAVAAQMLALAGVMAVCSLLQLGWHVWLGVAAVSLGALPSNVPALRQRRDCQTGCAWVSAGGSILLFASCVFSAGSMGLFDLLGVISAALLGVGTGLGAFRTPSSRRTWQALGLCWGFVSVLTWLCFSYAGNSGSSFYAAMIAFLGLLLLTKRIFRTSCVVAQIANTLLLLSLGLPITDWILRPTPPAAIDLNHRPYAFTSSGQDPAAFRRWWDAYRDQWDRMGQALFEPDPRGLVPLQLKPGATARLFESQISINSQGFRGSDFERKKPPGTYRIVALGESTTFGCTLRADDHPWPELLEQALHEQFKSMPRVEVVNAGVPALSLVHNVSRLAADILPLSPDLIISYHGYNGFRSLDNALPRGFGPPPPEFKARPLRLLAEVEYRVQLIRYSRQHARVPEQVTTGPVDIEESLETPFGRAYGELIAFCRSNGISLAVANFSMAVNQESAPEVKAFYRGGFPSLDAQVRANEVHTALVQEIWRRNADVIPIDTQARLNGDPGCFIDLIHLTQEGRQKLTEAVLNGLRRFLQELPQPPVAGG